MKLLNADQIRALDAYTIEHEPIASLDLMERAAEACAEWLRNQFSAHQLIVVCGTGNNGGDGLALARMLSSEGRRVEVWIAGNPNQGSTDFKANYERLVIAPNPCTMHRVDSGRFPEIPDGVILIDALFGTGLTRKVEGWLKALIAACNASHATRISIDIPSGLFADSREVHEGAVVQAHHTLTFQFPKRSLLFAEGGRYAGRIHVLPIGLDKEFHESLSSHFFWTGADEIRKSWKYRQPFEHKGTRGHLLLVAGGKGKMGAAILAARAALKSGAGLVTAHVPGIGLNPVQTAVPEAMCNPDAEQDFISQIEVQSHHSALAIGPGMGQNSLTALAVMDILEHVNIPLILDADALNSISREADDLACIPKGSILTPHPKEFDRLFGVHDSSADRCETLRAKAQELGLVIVLKGSFTRVALPDGSVHFNSSGNAGMATAGSGDVLTGIIGSLLAQGYRSADAAKTGVFLHGLAGDAIARKHGAEFMTSQDLTGGIPVAIQALERRD